MMGLIHHSTRISTEISHINKINTYFFRLKPVGGKMKIASIAVSAQHAFIRILKVFLCTLIYHFELNFSKAPVRKHRLRLSFSEKCPSVDNRVYNVLLSERYCIILFVT